MVVRYAPEAVGDVIDASAWEAFAGVGAVIVFLGSVVFGLQRLGFIGQKKLPPTPSPSASAEPATPSPEALALLEATRELVISVQAIADRSESLGRIHARLDGVNKEVAQVGSGVAHLKGELSAMNRTLHLIQEHLLAQK